MGGEGYGVQEDEVIALARLLLSLSIAAGLVISLEYGARHKESNGNNYTLDSSSYRDVLPRNDRGWSYDPFSLDELHQPPTPEAMPTQSLSELRVLRVEPTPQPRLYPSGMGEGTGVREVACQPIFTWNCDFAVATIYCESKNDPNAHGHEWYMGRLLHFHGWWQVLDGPFDPYLNTVEAHIKYHAWQRGEVADPWPNC